jgi:soluble lytic murein transglycosylase-like protein
LKPHYIEAGGWLHPVDETDYSTPPDGYTDQQWQEAEERLNIYARSAYPRLLRKRRRRTIAIALAIAVAIAAVVVATAGRAQPAPVDLAPELAAARTQYAELQASIAERLRYQERLHATLQQIAPLVPAEYRMMVIYSSMANGLDPYDLAAVGWVESRWQADAIGSSGEVGIMQILPSTGRWIADYMGLERYDLADPATNIAFGAAYLRLALNREGSMDRALAAYNGGPNGWDHKPISARGYVDRVRAAQ